MAHARNDIATMLTIPNSGVINAEGWYALIIAIIKGCTAEQALHAAQTGKLEYTEIIKPRCKSYFCMDISVYGNGLCEKCHNRTRWLKRIKSSMELQPPNDYRVQGCKIEGCKEKHLTHGYCSKHWQRILAKNKKVQNNGIS